MQATLENAEAIKFKLPEGNPVTRFYLFGGARVVRDGAPVHLGNKQQQLLAVLILFANRRVSSDVLVDCLWSDDLPANPLNSLQDVVKRLRHALDDWHHRLVVTQGRDYTLVIEPDELDIAIFQRLAKAGLAIAGAAPSKSYVLLAKALEIADGDLPDAKPGTRVSDHIDDIYSLRAAATRALNRTDTASPSGTGTALPFEGPGTGLAIKLADLEDLVLANVVLDVLHFHGKIRSFSDGLLVAAIPGAGAAVRCASAISNRLSAADGLLCGGICRLKPGGGVRCLNRLFDLVASAGRSEFLVTKDIKDAVETSGGAEFLRPYDGDLWQISSASASVAGRGFADDVPTVGRDETLGEISDLLERQLMITLRGPGGIGKTRMARELGRRLTKQFRDGVCFVDLTEADHHGGPLSLVARTLGFVPQPYRHLEDTLVDLLRNSERLLILDNCENFSEEMRSLCEAIGDGCPSVTILATSRSSLGCSREHICDVGELNLVDAAQLMVELAFPGAKGLADPLEPMILKLCSQLDSMPLAIECAASMVRAMGLAGAYAALGSLPDGAVLPLLDASHRGRGRHRSIELALNASYSLLREEDAVLHECLSSLRGTFRTEDAAGVVPGAEVQTVAEGLRRLWEASLVKRTGEGQWRLLEPVRQFGATRLLRRGEHSSQAARHARHFISLATKAEAGLTGVNAKLWFERLTDTYPNFDKALSWAVESGDAAGALQLTSSLWWYWAAKGMFVEGTGAVERALALEGPFPDALRAKTLVAASHLSWWAGNPHRTESSLIEAMEIISSVEPSDSSLVGLRAWAHTGLAAAHFWGGGDYHSLDRHLEDGKMLFASIGDLPGLGLNLSTHSGVAWHYGNDLLHYQKAMESLEVFSEAKHQTMVAHMKRVVGLAAARLGDVKRGRALVEEGLRLSTDIGDMGGLPLGYAFLGLLETWAESRDRANEAFTSSILANRRPGQVWPSLLTVAFAVEQAVLIGRPADAIRLNSAVESMSDRTRIRLAPDDRARVRLAVEDSINILESHEVTMLRTQGAAMSLPSATSVALGMFQQSQ